MAGAGSSLAQPSQLSPASSTQPSQPQELHLSWGGWPGVAEVGILVFGIFSKYFLVFPIFSCVLQGVGPSLIKSIVKHNKILKIPENTLKYLLNT